MSQQCHFLGMYPSGRYIKEVTILNIHFNIIHNIQYVKSGSLREGQMVKSPCWLYEWTWLQFRELTWRVTIICNSR